MSEIQKLKEITIKALYSLLISGNQSVTLSQLQKDYKSFTGCHIPFQRMGFNNLESFLRDYPSLFSIHWEGPQLMVSHVPSAGMEHIERLIKNQKPKKSKPQTDYKKFSSRGRTRPTCSPLPHSVPNIVRGQIRGLLMDYSHGMLLSDFGEAYSDRFGMPLNFNMFGFSSLLEMLKSMPDIVQIVHRDTDVYKVYLTTTRHKSPYSGVHKNVQVNSDGPDEDDWQYNNLDNSGVDPETQINIQQLLAKHKGGLWSTLFQDEYKAEYKKELDLHRLGFTSIINLMANLPHIVTVQRASQKDWLLFDARQKKQADVVQNETELVNITQKLDPLSPIDRKIKGAVCEAIGQNPQGLHIEELPLAFWNLTGERLEPNKLGYPDLLSLITDMDDAIDIDSSTGAVVLHQAVSAPSVDTSFKSATGVMGSFPFDVIGPGASFKQEIITPSKLGETGNYLEVFVATVLNPHKLWLQIKGPENSEQLDKLMDSLQITYSMKQLGEAYLLPDELIKPGQVCAAVYPAEGTWHRCQITAVKNKDFVELFYVDYGTTQVVAKGSLKFLRWCDFRLPAQAIPAKLGKLKPKNGVWTSEAQNLILTLVSDKPLFAFVTEVALDGTLTVSLTDTTGNDDVHIADELITSGLAELDITDSYKDPLMCSASEITNGSLSDCPSRTDFPLVENNRAMECERYVKFVQLTPDYSLHLIRYNDEPYVTTAEVSKLIWPGKDDILRIRFQQARQPLDRLLILRSENPLLFYELFRFHVLGTFNDNNKQKEFISVIKLKRVLDILEDLRHPSTELKKAVSREIAEFDPLSSFWMYKMDKDEEQQMIDYFLHKMDSTLKALHYKRKSILSAMNSMTSENCDVLVQSQQDVEKNIRTYSQCYSKLQRLNIRDS